MSSKRLETLQEAIRLEEQGKAYYEEARDKTTNRLGKEMFEFLIRAEEAHIRRIKQLYQAVEESGAWPRVALSREKEKAAKDVCAAVLSTLKENAPGEADDLDALRAALRIEDEGIRYYQCQADAAEELMEKKFYLMLVNEETDHWLGILDSLEFLTDPQAYYHQKEMTRSTFM